MFGFGVLWGDNASAGGKALVVEVGDVGDGVMHHVGEGFDGEAGHMWGEDEVGEVGELAGGRDGLGREYIEGGGFNFAGG